MHHHQMTEVQRFKSETSQHVATCMVLQSKKGEGNISHNATKVKVSVKKAHNPVIREAKVQSKMAKQRMGHRRR